MHIYIYTYAYMQLYIYIYIFWTRWFTFHIMLGKCINPIILLPAIGKL